MSNKDKLNKLIYITGALFVFLLFGYISYKTPLSGDDWGYALNYKIDNPFVMAYNFYFSWSGRFFSEVFDFLFCGNKWLWNICNPLIFVGIYALILKITDNKKHLLLRVLLAIFLMISVENNVRMEAYTFVTGCIYPVSLFFSLLYVCLSLIAIKNNKYSLFGFVVSNICLIIACLMVENISATLVFVAIIFSIYTFINNKNLFKYFVTNFVTSVLTFGIMRLSPGSTFRTLRDNADWLKLSVFEKIANGYPGFIEMTFISHKYMIIVLSLCLAALVLKNNKVKNMTKKILLAVILASSIFVVMSDKVFSNNNFLLDAKSFFSMVYWPLYTLLIIYVLFIYISNLELRLKILLLFVIGGASSMVMIFSPYYGYRCSIYVLYYLFIFINLIICELDINKNVVGIVCVILLSMIFVKGRYLINVYKEVGRVTQIRDAEIEYYKNNPEVEEVWIQRYPLLTIHGADVDPGDTYHFETFKDYYELPQSPDKIYFYVAE